MSTDKDDILEILSDFKDKKEKRQNSTEQELEPPRKREEYIDFSKPKDDEKPPEAKAKIKKLFNKAQKSSATDSTEEKEKKKELARQRLEKLKNGSKKFFSKAIKAVFNKKVLAAVAVIAVIIAGIFGAVYAAQQAKVAYLKPYQEKYPQVQFPQGILEKYCDIYGENPDTVGYIKIPGTSVDSAVNSDSKTYPYAQSCTKGSEKFNYVIYLDDDSLEELYSTADSYNTSDGYVTYSDLTADYTFKIVGAFYTNTDAKDDNGYVFPYNVTEEMTVDSQNEYISRLQSRFIYSTGIDITRQDKLITISCPTDYRSNFRFVVVGVMRDDAADKLTATEKDDVRYPQVIYDESKIQNPYKYASDWYPEIVITNSDGTQKTIQKAAEDYQNKQ